MQPERDTPTDRRRFLTTTAAAGAALGASVLIPEAVAAETIDVTEPQQKKPDGYQRTQHVLDYYNSAKL